MIEWIFSHLKSTLDGAYLSDILESETLWQTAFITGHTRVLSRPLRLTRLSVGDVGFSQAFTNFFCLKMSSIIV